MAESERLVQREANDIIAADVVDGQLVLRRYDGSKLTFGDAGAFDSDDEES